MEISEHETEKLGSLPLRSFGRYKRLVAELDKDQGRSVGECMLAMEGI